ncbi:NAD-dependent epimerase/dehydratase family protein [Variovorax saccharolyticus]|uniref:NAD-dependent epimerase/dehydratase family protein n=1 Tax=Variovorax saccharolyticus TaxID=3053516 RepID=UPI0025787408|nr:NAD-dependent epimerase/dehydratase family protein [Variovorax sp. J22R187]MDM0017908.1 NAD-dependent epimerase/dehydratase family protein [Variovorax sp. J22R187]
MNTSAHTPALLDERHFPSHFETEAALEQFLATPSRELVDDLARLPGDLMILGVGGKMGPTLARLARNALPADRRVIAVARFSEPGMREMLEGHGIETIACDLLDAAALAALPQCPNVIFMAGRKFGADADNPLTWAMNVHVPALVAQAFSRSRIVAFSTACVYPFVPVTGQGAAEDLPPSPPGEYANSCVGRERMFEYFSKLHGTPGRLFRLSYAIDLRYGVLADVAIKVWRGEPVDVTMGHVNVIWQGDANAQALRCLVAATVPTSPLNVSGPETTSIRWLAEEFGRRFDKPVEITGSEAPTAWLMNTGEAERLFGYPKVPLSQLIGWVADWIAREQRLYGKPTKFESRDGKY